MAVREIILYLNDKEALRKKCRLVKQLNRQIRELVQNLKDTLAHTSDGIGLAAPQIGVHRRVVAVRLGSGREDGKEAGPPFVLINPTIREASDEQPDFDGCLSFPGLYAETIRPHTLRVNGLDEWGRTLDRVFEGFDAVVVHHEIDHLDGVLFIDRVESIEDLYQVRMDENGQLVRVPVQTTGTWSPGRSFL